MRDASDALIVSGACSNDPGDARAVEWGLVRAARGVDERGIQDYSRGEIRVRRENTRVQDPNANVRCARLEVPTRAAGAFERMTAQPSTPSSKRATIQTTITVPPSAPEYCTTIGATMTV